MAKLLAVLAVVVIISPLAALADNGNHYGWSNGEGNPHNPHGAAPGPIAGAGLPALAIAGMGYLLYRRRQK